MFNTLTMLAVFLTDAQQSIMVDKPLSVKIVKDGIDWATRANWALVAVGIAGIGVALLTLRFIRRQVNLMEHQTKILEDSVAAAQKSADAALLNAQAIIASERPFITVEVKPSPNGDSFQVLATNCGKTPAEIRIHGSEYRFFANDDGPPLPPKYNTDGYTDVYRRIAAPGGVPFAVGNPLTISNMRSGSPAQMDEVNTSTKFLFYWGKIVYISCGLNRSMQHWLEVYSPEFENPRSLAGVD